MPKPINSNNPNRHNLSVLCPVSLIALTLCGVLGLNSPSAEAQTVFIQQSCTATWNANNEPDLAGYRMFAVKGAVSKPVVTIPVGPAPKATCAQLGIDSDGVWTLNLVAFDDAQNASAPPTVASATRDTVAPNTTVVATIAGVNASFALTSNETGSIFDCKLDAGAWASCPTPKTYTALADGAHTFNARATDQAKNTDLTEAAHTWSVNTSAPSQPTGLVITPNFP